MWALELGSTTLRLVHLKAEAAGFLVSSYTSVPREDRWPSSSRPTRTAQVLSDKDRPRAVSGVMADGPTLYRTLSLPEADRATSEKMIRNQLETVLPADPDSFAWGWQDQEDSLEPGGRRVLVCAARAKTVRSAVQAAKASGLETSLLLPSSVALATAVSRLCPLQEPHTALIDVAGRSTSVAVVGASGLLRCSVLGLGGDHWSEQLAEELEIAYEQAEQLKMGLEESAETSEIASRRLQEALLDWAQQLREVYDGCVRDLPLEQRPRQCLLFGRAAQTVQLRAQLEGTLQLKVQWPLPKAELSCEGEIPFAEAATAIGAAMCALDAAPATVSLLPATSLGRPSRTIRVRRWAALVGWLALAVLALYGLDLREARWLGGAVDQIKATSNPHGGLDQELAIARYLEKAGTPPLEILAELSEVAPEKLLLLKWTYRRSGQVSLAGTVPGRDQLDGFLNQLHASQALKHVQMRELRALRKEEVKKSKMPGNQVAFEISAVMARGLLPPRPEAAPATSSEQDSETQEGPSQGGEAEEPK